VDIDPGSVTAVRLFGITFFQVSCAGLLPDRLPLAAEKVFEDVVSAENPMNAAYGISGQIYRFALEENGSPPHALLDLEISLWQENPRTVLFRKHFHYQSPPLTSTGPSEFAAAMAGLVAQLSTDLRNDLCAITQDSSHPAGR